MANEAVHEAAQAAGGAASEAAHAVFPPFDPTYFPSQLLWLAITFIGFYFVMKKLAVPQIGGIISERAGRVSGDLAQAEKLKGETDAAMAAYEKALAEARSRAHKIAEEANEKASAAAKVTRAATEAELAKKLAAAETRINAIKAQALGEVGSIAADTVEAVLERLIGPGVEKAEIGAAVSAELAAKGGGNAR